MGLSEQSRGVSRERWMHYFVELRRDGSSFSFVRLFVAAVFAFIV